MVKKIVFFIIEILIMFSICSCNTNEELTYSELQKVIEDFPSDFSNEKNVYSLRYKVNNDIIKTYMYLDNNFISVILEEEIIIYNKEENCLYILESLNNYNDELRLSDLTQVSLDIQKDLRSFLNYLEEEKNIDFIVFDYTVFEIFQEIVSEKKDSITYRKAKASVAPSGTYLITIKKEAISDYEKLSNALKDLEYEILNIDEIVIRTNVIRFDLRFNGKTIIYDMEYVDDNFEIVKSLIESN